MPLPKEITDLMQKTEQSAMSPYEMEQTIHRMNLCIMALSKNQSHLIARIKELEKVNGITPDIPNLDDIIN